MFGVLQVSYGTYICFADTSYGLEFCHAIEPCFPAASIRLHRSVCITDNVQCTRIASSKVPFLLCQKPIALFRRFVVAIGNSLIFIAITLIVSVTAPRRAPRTNRTFLLLPLDSPLSVKLQPFGSACVAEKNLGFAICKAPALLPFGVCPYLFCNIIISSTLHNVKGKIAFFHGNFAPKKIVFFSDFPLSHMARICYNGIVGCAVSIRQQCR